MPRRTFNAQQPTLFEEEATGNSAATSSTFVDNMALAIHRWFRYSAGFSAVWVRGLIRSAKANGRAHILDPFSGSGTVLLEAQNAGVPSYGVESHPFVGRVANAKLLQGVDAEALKKHGMSILKNASRMKGDIQHYSSLIRKCFPDGSLMQLDQLRKAILEFEESDVGEIAWLALAAILRQCSPVGTANWQYILPRKSKANVSLPFDAYRAKILQMSFDLAESPRCLVASTLIRGDARELRGIPDGWASLVITSPPYPNNFDYADATRLEMTFFGEITGWGDLQESVRQYLVRSCTQHVSPIVADTNKILVSAELEPIRSEIADVCERLEKERHSHGGKKNYHTMIAAYFSDMAKVWLQLRRVTSRGSKTCFVIGDSAPYGIYVPVETWMGKLALAAGFHTFTFEKTRDRNIKWKNRKHRVPLHEGQLWVEG